MPDAIEFDPAAVAIALADLRAAGDHEAADALLAATPAVAKSMGELAGSAGGFLVPPAAAVKRKRKRKRKLRGCIRKALADLED